MERLQKTPSETPATASPKNFGGSTTPPLYSTERAKLLFGCYRRSDANDPDLYVTAIAAVLSGYEPDLVRTVTDPRTGISTSEKFRAFPPSSGELKAYCDEHAAIRARHKRYAALPPPVARSRPPLDTTTPGRRAQLTVPRSVMPRSVTRYAEMVERAKTADPADWKMVPEGIKIPHNWWFGDKIGAWK